MRPENPVNNEHGAVAVIVAICMVMLIGFAALVLDIGALYERRRQTQTAVDGAALAGAQDLPDQGLASNSARKYLIDNGVTNVAGAGITFPTGNTIRVTAAPQNVAFSLAPAIGYNSSTVSATAVAIKEFRQYYVPWALVLEGLTPAQQSGAALVTLDATAGGSTTGNFQMLNIPRDGTGGANPTLIANVEEGCDHAFAVNDVLDTLTGNRVGPLTTGMLNSDPPGLLTQGSCPETAVFSQPGHASTQIDACNLSCVFGTSTGSAITQILEPGCPRIVRVPVIASWPKGASTQVTVLSLVWFFIATPPPPSSGSISTLSGYVLNGLPQSAWPYNIRLIE